MPKNPLETRRKDQQHIDFLHFQGVARCKRPCISHSEPGILKPEVCMHFQGVPGKKNPQNAGGLINSHLLTICLHNHTPSQYEFYSIYSLLKDYIYYINVRYSVKKKGEGDKKISQNFYKKIFFQPLGFFFKLKILGSHSQLDISKLKMFSPGKSTLTHLVPPGPESTKTLHFRMAPPGDTW